MEPDEIEECVCEEEKEPTPYTIAKQRLDVIIGAAQVIHEFTPDQQADANKDRLCELAMITVEALFTDDADDQETGVSQMPLPTPPPLKASKRFTLPPSKGGSVVRCILEACQGSAN